MTGLAGLPDFGFGAGPQYRPASRQETILAAFDQPMSMGATFWDQVAGGALSSPALGTGIREAETPDLNLDALPLEERQSRQLWSGPAGAGRAAREALGFRDEPDTRPVLSEEVWKASPFFRADIPWDAAMTEDRAAALALQYDRRKVREHFASKRPITAFFGNLAGQALDPINYIPIAGPTVRGANIARIAGRSAADAAANTALFGLVARDQRVQFGDDVSWQATVSEIAAAALIGAGFGAAAGGLAKFLDVRTAKPMIEARQLAERQLATLQTTQEARVALNEGIGAMARGEDIVLSPSAVEPIQRRAEQLDLGGMGEARPQAKAVVTPTGMRIDVQSEIVDARTLVKAAGDLQPRDRTRAGSDAQIAEIAANLDPARLMYAPEADRGAPVVGPDNMVESGNGRVAAIIRARETNPEGFRAYVAALKEAGFDVPSEGIPILVSRRVSTLSPEERVRFVNEANTSAIARMSATEVAGMDVRAMTADVLSNYVPGEVTSAGNRAFVGSFMRNLPPNERLALADAQGRLNADGVRRIENALIAAAYGDADVVARFAETPDDNVKSIMGAMSDAAGEWAAMRREIAQGLIDADFDVTPNLTDALRFISRARQKAAAEKQPIAGVIRDGLKQIDLLAGGIDPRTKAFIEGFYKSDRFTQANGRDILADHLKNIVAAARNLGKPQLFGDATAVTPAEMIANARPQARQADLLGAAGAGPGRSQDGIGQERLADGGNRAAYPQGAQQARLDTSPPRPDPVPEGRAEAEAKVAKAEDAKAIAQSHRVDMETGSFVEEAELRQLDAEGRLTDEDREAMQAANEAFDNGSAYGEALKAAVACLI